MPLSPPQRSYNKVFPQRLESPKLAFLGELSSLTMELAKHVDGLCKSSHSNEDVDDSHSLVKASQFPKRS